MSTTAPTTGPVLTPAMRAEIEKFIPRYPNKQAVTLPALHVVNEHLRCVPMAAIPEIAEILGLAPAEVHDTLSFYQFFKHEPCGKVRAWVCRSIACALRGADEIIGQMEERLGVHCGETTPDGRITLEFGECLGVCEYAPAILANEKVYKNIAVEQVPAVCDELKAQADAGG